MTVENVCEYIKDIVENHFEREFSVADLCNWSCMKGCIRKKVVNYERNKQYLQDKVHRRYLDLAEVCYTHIQMDKKKAVGDIPVQMATDIWKVSVEEVFKMAERNMEKEGYNIQPIEELLSMEMTDFPMRPKLYVVTNKESGLGAGIISNPELFRDVMKDVNGNFYIFPSSVHELVLKEESLDDSLENMKALVSEVNDSCVLAGEYLSDNVYYYNACTGEISLCE